MQIFYCLAFGYTKVAVLVHSSYANVAAHFSNFVFRCHLSVSTYSYANVAAYKILFQGQTFRVSTHSYANVAAPYFTKACKSSLYNTSFANLSKIGIKHKYNLLFLLHLFCLIQVLQYLKKNR